MSVDGFKVSVVRLKEKHIFFFQNFLFLPLKRAKFGPVNDLWHFRLIKGVFKITVEWLTNGQDQHKTRTSVKRDLTVFRYQSFDYLQTVLDSTRSCRFHKSYRWSLRLCVASISLVIYVNRQTKPRYRGYVRQWRGLLYYLTVQQSEQGFKSTTGKRLGYMSPSGNSAKDRERVVIMCITQS